MKEIDYIREIGEKISIFITKTKALSSINLNDVTIEGENFCCQLLNLIYGKNYVNMNSIAQNNPGFDLLCEEGKEIVQVTVDTGMPKIKSTLETVLKGRYKDYSLYFLYISHKKPLRKRKEIKLTRETIVFDCANRIYTLLELSKKASHLKNEKLEEILELCNKYIPYEKPREGLKSGLIKVIDMLSEIGKLESSEVDVKKSFEISKKISYNDLSDRSALIKERSQYGAMLQSVYDDYDSQGANKSVFVIDSISRAYWENESKYTGVELFNIILKNLRKKIEFQAAFNHIDEELDFYLDIIVVDAFNRCKIFKHPQSNDFTKSSIS